MQLTFGDAEQQGRRKLTRREIVDSPHFNARLN